MDFQQARFNMVEQQIRPWDVLDFNVLDALEAIPREQFVQAEQRGYAYADMLLKLPNGYHMLEPKIVARMAQALALNKREYVLEIGTGSGYATAVLAHLAAQVDTVDIDAEQQQIARQVLTKLNLLNIRYEQQDAFAPEQSETRYDAIYVGGSLPVVPDVLKNRLSEHGGRMVIIVGTSPVQRCVLITRQQDDFTEKTLFDTFVPPLSVSAIIEPMRFVF